MNLLLFKFKSYQRFKNYSIFGLKKPFPILKV